MSAAPLTLRAIRATAVEVPMAHVLGTSQATVRAAPLLLLDLETEQGVTGRAYLFCYVRAAAPAIAAIVAEIERGVKGERVAPLDLWQKLDALAAKHEIKWHWVKGHAGTHGNERADELANEGMAPFKKKRAS